MNQAIEINGTNFETEVLKATELVIVDFWAEWCGPCKMLAPVLDQIAAEHAGRIKVAKVNVDTHQALAERYGIRSIPTLIYFVDGEPVDQSVGAMSRRALLAKIEALAPAA
jgi:thioredoxin 1